MRKIIILLFGVFCLWQHTELTAQQKFTYPAKKNTAASLTHQPVDLVFSATVPPGSNPFDLVFGAVFTNSKKQQKTIQGFYNGQKEYIIRFCPDETDEYQYQTFSTQASLTGLKGSVKVEKNPNPDIHGGVVVSPEQPQKFRYQDGRPYFALAFELDWLFALDMNSKSGMPKSEEIIRSVKKNGFNQVVMNVYAYDVGWKTSGQVPPQYQFGKPAYSVFRGSNEQPDFEQLNTDLFQHLDRVVQHLHEQGIVAHLMIYVWNKKVNWPEMYSVADNRYFDYVIKRYQAYPNILWDVSKEALDYGRCDIPYINERIERIRRNDVYKRLVTVHDYEYCAREPDKVDFISIQNWRSDLYSLSLEAYQRHPGKPVMNIEHGGYEEGPFGSFTGNYTNAEFCLERNYACVFAGVYSCYYWQNTSWDIVIYDALDPDQRLPKPRFDYYRHLQTLFTRYDFNELQPYKPKLTTNSRLGNDNLSSSAFPLTNNRDLYLYYVPRENFMVNVIIPKPAGGKIAATWFNIFTGESSKEEESDWYLFKGYQSPWKGQAAVLILQGK